MEEFGNSRELSLRYVIFATPVLCSLINFLLPEKPITMSPMKPRGGIVAPTMMRVPRVFRGFRLPNKKKRGLEPTRN